MEDEMVGWHHQLRDVSLSKLQDIVKDRGTWRAPVHGVAKSQTRLATEEQQQHSIISQTEEVNSSFGQWTAKLIKENCGKNFPKAMEEKPNIKWNVEVLTVQVDEKSNKTYRLMSSKPLPPPRISIQETSHAITAELAPKPVRPVQSMIRQT